MQIRRQVPANAKLTPCKIRASPHSAPAGPACTAAIEFFEFIVRFGHDTHGRRPLQPTCVSAPGGVSGSVSILFARDMAVVLSHGSPSPNACRRRPAPQNLPTASIWVVIYCSAQENQMASST
jgi:hypothetical protein